MLHLTWFDDVVISYFDPPLFEGSDVAGLLEPYADLSIEPTPSFELSDQVD